MLNNTHNLLSNLGAAINRVRELVHVADVEEDAVTAVEVLIEVGEPPVVLGDVLVGGLDLLP